MTEYAQPSKLYDPSYEEQINLLTKYFSAIHYAKRERPGFEETYGQTIAEYRRTDECRQAHKLAHGLKL